MHYCTYCSTNTFSQEPYDFTGRPPGKWIGSYGDLVAFKRNVTDTGADVVYVAVAVWDEPPDTDLAILAETHDFDTLVKDHTNSCKN